MVLTTYSANDKDVRDELHSSAIQYMIGDGPITNIGTIIESKDYECYKAVHPAVKPFKYAQAKKREWRKILGDKVVPLEDELR